MEQINPNEMAENLEKNSHTIGSFFSCNLCYICTVQNIQIYFTHNEFSIILGNFRHSLGLNSLYTDGLNSRSSMVKILYSVLQIMVTAAAEKDCFVKGHMRGC